MGDLNESIIASMKMPPVRGAKSFIFLHGIAITGVCFALPNLINYAYRDIQAIAASLIWVSLYPLGICSYFFGLEGEENKTKVRGLFSQTHFIDAVKISDANIIIDFGFQFFGRKYYYKRIDIMCISNVRWWVGQGGTYWVISVRHFEGEIFCLPQSGTKNEIEILGSKVVSFLRLIGVGLKATESPTEFSVIAHAYQGRKGTSAPHH